MVRLLASRFCSVLGAVGGNEDGGGVTGLIWDGCSRIRGVDCSLDWDSVMFWELGGEMFWGVGMFMLAPFVPSSAFNLAGSVV